MIFGWKKNRPLPEPSAPLYSERLRARSRSPHGGLIKFERVSLPPAIKELNLEIPLGSWTVLYGEDDFAKALFCDLCFSYIQPESGKVHPVLKGTDVSFLGRSNTTYGNSLVEHLSCGVRENTKDLLEYVALRVLSERFGRHLEPRSPLEFSAGRGAREVPLDERDCLEIAEANVLLQRRKAAVIDTTSDFYQIAIEQGFRHSDELLTSGKTILWIVDDQHPLPANACPWREKKYANVPQLSLGFPSGSPAGYIN